MNMTVRDAKGAAGEVTQSQLKLVDPPITLQSIDPNATTYTDSEVVAIMPLNDVSKRYWDQNETNAPYLVFFAAGGRAPYTSPLSMERLAAKSGLEHVPQDSMLINRKVELKCDYHCARDPKTAKPIPSEFTTVVRFGDSVVFMRTTEEELAGKHRCNTRGPETVLLKSKRPTEAVTVPVARTALAAN
jgi:hypothetical protein